MENSQPQTAKKLDRNLDTLLEELHAYGLSAKDTKPEGVDKHYRSTCPACGSGVTTSQALRTLVYNDGGYSMVCFAERCSHSEIWIGLETGEPPVGIGRGGDVIQRKRVTSYIYKDKDGQTLYRVARDLVTHYDGSTNKSLYFEHLSNGRWISGMGGAKHVPLFYRHLLSPKCESIWLCEGEKDAVRAYHELRKVGMFGAVVPTTVDSIDVIRKHIRVFAGKRITIFEDNDKTGREKAAQASGILQLIADVGIVHFRDMSEKSDVSDFLDHWSIKELVYRAAMHSSPALDGRLRNIYASIEHKGKRHDVRRPDGEFLYNVLPDGLFTDITRFSVYDKTGGGKTYALIRKAFEAGKRFVFVTSLTFAREQAANLAGQLGATFQVQAGNIDSIDDGTQIVFCCYESFPRLLNMLDADRFGLIVDEIHNVATSGEKTFRGDSLDAVLDTFHGAWQFVATMTGTPIPSTHPMMQDFELIAVQSHVRNRAAVRVVVNPNVKGNRINKMLRVIADSPEDRHCVYLGVKGTQLRKLIGKLIALGYERDEIGVLTADNKDSDIGRMVRNEERVPSEIRVLIVTKVAIEAINIKSQFNTIHVVKTDLSAELIEQLCNRFRRSNPRCYWYNSGTGKGYARPHEIFAKSVLDAASLEADHYRAQASIDPDDDSAEAVNARRTARHYSSGISLTRVDEIIQHGAFCKHFEISYTACDAEIHKRMIDYANRNPRAQKAALEPYGFVWLDDIDPLPMVFNESQQSRAERAIAQDEAATAAEFSATIATIQDEGEDVTRRLLRRASGSALQQRTRRRVVSLSDELGYLRDSWQWSLNKIAALGDSTRAYNTAKRQVRAHRLKASCRFTQTILGAFEAGKRYSGVVIHERMLALFAADPVLSIYASERYALPWHTERSTRLSQRKSVALFKELFSVSEKKGVVGDDGKRQREYEILNRNPLNLPDCPTTGGFSSENGSCGTETPQDSAEMTTGPADDTRTTIKKQFDAQTALVNELFAAMERQKCAI